MSKTTRLIRSGFAALAIITAVTATAQVLFPQVAMTKGHEHSGRDHAKDGSGHEKAHDSRG